MGCVVYYYIDDRGRNPVKEFIKDLPDIDKAKAFAYIKELKRQGHNLRRPLADYLTDGIYELRPKKNRIFYFFYLKDSAVLLHAVKKKTQKIQKSDLKICLKRKNYVINSPKLEKID